jgi:thiol-disulfide isomerase/thioredoxin
LQKSIPLLIVRFKEIPTFNSSYSSKLLEKVCILTYVNVATFNYYLLYLFINLKKTFDMKKILSLSLAAMLVFGFAACKKNASNSTGTNPFGNTTTTPTTPPAADPLAEVGALPADYTKKAILEEFTGEWCGWCPEGAEIMNQNLAANPNTVVGIAVHDGDPMELPSFNSWIKTLTNVAGFPNGSVNRADATGRSSWTGQINTELAKVADLGMAIVSKTNGNMVDIKVFVGYKMALGTDKLLTIAITEDDVAQSSPGAQGNYSATVVVDPNTWTHSHVLRGFVTNEQGDAIDMTSPKNYTIVEFKNVDLSSMNISNMANVEIAAFIHSNTAPRDVFNAQKAKLDETKKWD